MIAGRRIRLREKRASDAPEDYSWHVDSELAELDATTPVTASYAHYLMDFADELRQPTPGHQRFAIETNGGKHIGNCAYYGISEARGEAEIGIMIGNRSYWDQGYGTEVIGTLVDHIFRRTTLKRLHLKTLDWNGRAQRCFAKSGFSLCGRLRKGKYSFITMELYRGQWEKARLNEETADLAQLPQFHV